MMVELNVGRERKKTVWRKGGKRHVKGCGILKVPEVIAKRQREKENERGKYIKRCGEAGMAVLMSDQS